MLPSLHFGCQHLHNRGFPDSTLAFVLTMLHCGQCRVSHPVWLRSLRDVCASCHRYDM